MSYHILDFYKDDQHYFFLFESDIKEIFLYRLKKCLSEFTGKDLDRMRELLSTYSEEDITFGTNEAFHHIYEVLESKRGFVGFELQDEEQYEKIIAVIDLNEDILDIDEVEEKILEII